MLRHNIIKKYDMIIAATCKNIYNIRTVFVLYTFNFSVDKFSNLISSSIKLRGENAIEEDAKLLYYYLCQKYSHSEIEKVIKCIDIILNQIDEKEIHNLLIDFANRN